jgi:type IV pilus assembly protein PilB
MTTENDNLDGSYRRRAEAIARQYDCEFVDLSDFHVRGELLKKMPAELIFRDNFVPLEETSDGRLAIAVADPSQLLMLDEISRLLKKRVETKVSTLKQINNVLKKAEASGQ